jgi:hypothetical protein
MNTSILYHRRCDSCGERICDESICEVVRLFATPLAGPLKGKRLLVTDVTIVGSGRWIVEYVRAAWTAQVPPRDDRFYAYSRIYGVLELQGPTLQANTPSLKALARHLGTAFVCVQRGIFVALSEVLVPALEDGMCGILHGDARASQPVIDWVICSRRGNRRLAERLG